MALGSQTHVLSPGVVIGHGKSLDLLGIGEWMEVSMGVFRHLLM